MDALAQAREDVASGGRQRHGFRLHAFGAPAQEAVAMQQVHLGLNVYLGGLVVILHAGPLRHGGVGILHLHVQQRFVHGRTQDNRDKSRHRTNYNRGQQQQPVSSQQPENIEALRAFLLVGGIRQNIRLCDGGEHGMVVAHQAIHGIFRTTGKEAHGYSSPWPVWLDRAVSQKKRSAPTGKAATAASLLWLESNCSCSVTAAIRRSSTCIFSSSSFPSR